VSDVRVRRHTDGRVAVKLAAGPWHMVYGWLSEQYPSQDEINGSGEWSELLVAELPEPDGWTNEVGDKGQDVVTPYWQPGYGSPITARIDGVETEEIGLEPEVEQLRSDALKMLAAVAACERYRAEQET